MRAGSRVFKADNGTRITVSPDPCAPNLQWDVTAKGDFLGCVSLVNPRPAGADTSYWTDYGKGPEYPTIHDAALALYQRRCELGLGGTR